LTLQNGHFLGKRERLSAPKGNFGSNPGTPETERRAKSPYLWASLRTVTRKIERLDWLAEAAGFELQNSHSEMVFETWEEFRTFSTNCGSETFTRQSCLGRRRHLSLQTIDDASKFDDCRADWI
jgi:hypothetical protein